MGDAFVVPVWLGATLLLVWSAWRLGQWLSPHDALGPCLMHTIVFSWACIVGVATLLGIVGWLSPEFLMAGVSVVAGLSWWQCCRVQRFFKELAVKISPSSDQSTEGESVPKLAVPHNVPSFHALWQLLWTSVLAWAVSWTIWTGLFRFPDGFDTLVYHLPLIVQWLHQGSFYAPADAFWYAPGNNELLGLWLVGPFSGDFLIALMNLPSVLLLASATMELTCSLDMVRPVQHLTALAVLATWPVFLHLNDAQNDVAVAGLFMAVLAYGVRYARQNNRSDLALAAVSLGLLAGVKYYALGYACVAGVGLTLLMLMMRGLRTSGRTVLVLGIGVWLWGGYWYARNLSLTGSPIYPQGITTSNDMLRQMRLSDGESPVWQTTLLGNGRPEVFPLLRQAVWRLTGPCHATALLLMPIVVAWLIGSGMWLPHYAGSSGLLRLILAFWIVAAGLIWIITPFAAEHVTGTLDSLRGGNTAIRYSLCFLSLCVVGLALMLQDLSQLLRRLMKNLLSRPINKALMPASSAWHYMPSALDAALVFVFLWSLAAAVVYQFVLLTQRHIREDLLDVSMLALNVWLVGMICVLLWHIGPRLRRALTAAIVPGLLAGAIMAVVFLAQHWHTGFAAHYESRGWNGLSTIFQTAEPSTTHICALMRRYYPLFGSRRQFRVYRPAWLPSYDALLKYLQDQDISLVIAIQSDIFHYGGKSDWIRKHPELFVVLQDGPQYLICRVNQDRLQQAMARR